MSPWTVSEREPGHRFPLRRVRIPRLLLVAGAALLGLVGLTQAQTAAASSLGLTTGTIGSGFVAVAPCTSLAGASVGYRVTAGTITGVTVAGLTAACDGKRVSLTLQQGTAPAAQGGPVVVAGGTATFVTLTATPVASTVTTASLVVVG